VYRRLAAYGRLVFLAGWISLLYLIATNIQSGWLYVVISFLLLVGLYSVIIPIVALRGVSVAVRLPELSELGAASSGRLTISNKSRFAKYVIRVDFSEYDEMSFGASGLLASALPGRSNINFRFDFTPGKRGRRHIKKVMISCGAPTGLFVAHRVMVVNAETIVHPRISDAAGEAVLGRMGIEGVGELSTRSSTPDPYLYRLREYAPGDSLRNIHWKLTARLGEPVVKDSERRTHTHKGVFIDNLRSSYPAGAEIVFESILEEAASVAHRLLFVIGASVTISGSAAPAITIESPESWRTALRWLALIEIEDEQPPDFLDAEQAGLEQIRFSPSRRGAS